MKSIVQERYGPSPENVLRLAEIDKPTIGRDEVLVRVHAASVDRGTWHIMSGLPYPVGRQGSVSVGPSTPTRAAVSRERSRPSAAM
ncbi:hypothetical protein GCM10010307_21050 [Streptomyces vastus]|uniref:Alcohol dehydrogenase N-terminal domain-containing protein n=1 Tax=Streptomyces vastus TaxID=285451 RepID=A0ABP6CZL4_9ACTN